MLPARCRRRAGERVQHVRQVLGRRRDDLDDVLVEGDEPDAVALLVREVREAGGEVRA